MKFKLAYFLLLTASLNANALIINQTAFIDLETDGRVIPFFPNPAWEGTVDLDSPVSFQTGDIFNLSIRFKNNKSLLLSDYGNSTGLELSKLSLLFGDPSNNNWRTSGTYNYRGVGGSLLINPASFSVSGGGGALQGPFDHKNLTDTSFSYSGIDINILFNGYTLNAGTGLFTRFEWSSAAESVQIIDTPASVPVTALFNGRLAELHHDIFAE